MRRSALGCAWWGLTALLFLGSGRVTSLQAAPSWEAVSGCPSGGEFEQALEGAGLDTLDSELRFRVRAQRGGYQMNVFDGELETHQLKAQECRELLDAALMILRLGQNDAKAREQDSDARVGSASSSSSGVEGSTTVVGEQEGSAQGSAAEQGSQAESDAIQESDAASDPADIQGAAAEEPTAEKRKARDRQAAQAARAQRRARRRARWANRKRLAGLVILQGGGALGALPSLHGQGLIDAGLQFGSWRILAGALGSWGAKSSDSVPEEWRSQFRTLGGRAQACYTLGKGRWRWPLCAGGSAGQLRAWRDTDAPGPKQVDTLWWSLQLQVGVELELTRRLFATANLKAALLPQRPQVQIENGPDLCCGMIQGGASLGMGVRVGRVP